MIRALQKRDRPSKFFRIFLERKLISHPPHPRAKRRAAQAIGPTTREFLPKGAEKLQKEHLLSCSTGEHAEGVGRKLRTIKADLIRKYTTEKLNKPPLEGQTPIQGRVR